MFEANVTGHKRTVSWTQIWDSGQTLNVHSILAQDLVSAVNKNEKKKGSQHTTVVSEPQNVSVTAGVKVGLGYRK